MTRPLRAALLAALLCLAGALPGPAPAGAQRRPLLVVTTDIGGDPDDEQSLRRLMLYANEVEIAGLIASASGLPGEVGRAVTRPELIRRVVDDYAAVRDNLALHAPGYPTADALRAVIRAGSPARGVEHLGEGKDTEGSRHIVAVVDAAAGPVHLAVWGGAHDLAQALHDVRRTRAPAEVAAFVARLRVYAIGDQDAPRAGGTEGLATGEWIRASFPALRYLQAGEPNASPYRALFRGMYQNDSAGGGHPVLPLVTDEVAALNQAAWLERHVRSGHGPLGAGYPVVAQNPGTPRNRQGVKEGDTPSWLYLLPTGLSDPEHPSQGGWGGRFERVREGFHTDAADEHPSGSDDLALRRKWTVARWRAAYQNDFAARMDWCVLPVAAANHAPRAVVAGDTTRALLVRRVAPGETVTLSAGGSRDPDGDRLSYRWWVYREPSGVRAEARVRTPAAQATAVEVPREAVGGSIHLVLEVTDDGEHPLTSYRRVILEVGAAGSPPAVEAAATGGRSPPARAPGEPP